MDEVQNDAIEEHTIPSVTNPSEYESPESAPKDEPYSVFSRRTTIYLTYLLGFIIIISTLTATIYFPLIPMLSKHFSVSIEAINLTVTVYAICQAISPAVFASLADSYGRRPVMLTIITVYACASLGLALNRTSYPILMALRALQSISGSSTPTIAYGIVADVSPVSDRGKMLGPMLATCNAISAVGPVIGGAVASTTSGYTWVFFSLLLVAVISVLLVGFTLPETARNIVGNGSRPVSGIWKTWIPISSGNKYERETGTTQVSHQSGPRTQILGILSSLRIMFYPDAAIILWMIAASYSIYYTFQVAIPVIFEEVYDYNNLEIGLVFLPGLAGMTMGGIVAGKLIDKNFAAIAQEHTDTNAHSKAMDLAKFPIEEARYRRIIPFITAEIALVACYGWMVQKHYHAAVPIILQFFVCALSTLLSHTASALLVDIFPHMPSTAYASSQIARCGMSAASAAIIEPLVRKLGRGWYFTIFSLFTGMSCIFCVVLSRWKGCKWRQRRLESPGRATGESEEKS